MNKNGLKQLISEVMGEIARDSIKSRIKKLVVESIEEIKIENDNCIAHDMEEIEKIIKNHNKNCEVIKDDKGNYNIVGIPSHNFSIRPMSPNIYDVEYIKDTTDRSKKLNLKIEELKDYINEKLKDKDGNYVTKAHNKSAENSKDVVEKPENSIRNDIVTKKEITDKKNDNKDYNEMPVKDDDLPDKPMKDVESIKKQSEHPIKGTKPDYTYPKLDKKQSKLTVKPTTFKGKARKKK